MRHYASRGLLAVLSGFIAITAIAGATLVVPTLPPAWLEGSVLDAYTIPAIALGFVGGLAVVTLIALVGPSRCRGRVGRADRRGHGHLRDRGDLGRRPRCWWSTGSRSRSPGCRSSTSSSAWADRPGARPRTVAGHGRRPRSTRAHRHGRQPRMMATRRTKRAPDGGTPR